MEWQRHRHLRIDVLSAAATAISAVVGYRRFVFFEAAAVPARLGRQGELLSDDNQGGYDPISRSSCCQRLRFSLDGGGIFQAPLIICPSTLSRMVTHAEELQCRGGDCRPLPRPVPAVGAAVWTDKAAHAPRAAAWRPRRRRRAHTRPTRLTGCRGHIGRGLSRRKRERRRQASLRDGFAAADDSRLAPARPR